LSGNHSYTGDISAGDLNTILWGCIGLHYSGNWFDGDSNNGAIGYIDNVQKCVRAKKLEDQMACSHWPD